MAAASKAVPHAPPAVTHELRMQRMLMAYIATGLLFLLLPGTFLGFWNLVSISSHQALASLSPAWIQAHGHAQIFGWVGTFILGIGFYSLTKMGRLPPMAVPAGWTAFALWTAGIVVRWWTGVSGWKWQILLPLSAFLQLAAFLLFFRTVTRHRPRKAPAAGGAEPWMRIVTGSTLGFLLSLVANAAITVQTSLAGAGPAIAPQPDQHLVTVATWGFLVPAIWGFNARWLPVFLGLAAPRARSLFLAFGTVWMAILAGLAGYTAIFGALLPAAALLSAHALRVAEPPVQPAKTSGVHRSFPFFVRLAYVWLLVSAVLTLFAALYDRSGGIGGAARHALTVGFISTMVFSIGQRVLPAFCGARVLYSPALMAASLVLLTAGCTLRVTAEIPAYEANALLAWRILPLSATLEVIAVTLFAANLAITFFGPPAHLRRQAVDEQQ